MTFLVLLYIAATAAATFRAGTHFIVELLAAQPARRQKFLGRVADHRLHLAVAPVGHVEGEERARTGGKGAEVPFGGREHDCRAFRGRPLRHHSL